MMDVGLNDRGIDTQLAAILQSKVDCRQHHQIIDRFERRRREPVEATSNVKPLTPSMSVALLLPAAGTLFLGIFPTWLLEFAGRSAASLK